MADWPSIADRAIRRTQARLGEPATYHGSGGDVALEHGAIFDDEHAEADLVTGELATSEPMASIRIADLTDGIAHVGDELTVRTVRWRIAEVHPDGQGAAVLMLEAL